ncbi:MAG: MBL fold metallo-hydrolase [Proteobacteria bacterium]|nr:MBL fold metallo-hydrolase [Pseudomonadota bacterium]
MRPKGATPIIIDAGTGIRKLGKLFMQSEFGDGRGVAHLLISHTHWDHIQGLPFFSPLYQQGNELHLFARQRNDMHLRAIFESQTEDPYFPVPMSTLKADIRFHELVEGQRFDIGRAKITCTRLNHPWIAMAYRIDVDGAAMVYASDTAPFTDILLEQEFIREPPILGEPIDPAKLAKLEVMRSGLVHLCRGADLLIYDTQFTQKEYCSRPHWGHSTPDDAIAIAREAGVATLALYHHAQWRSDDQQDEILHDYRAKTIGEPFELIAAHEGMELILGDDD